MIFHCLSAILKMGKYPNLQNGTKQKIFDVFQFCGPNRHSLEAAANNKAYHCGRCGKSYHYYSGLYRHTKYECGIEPQFECKFCGRKFKQKVNLKAHYFVHSESIKNVRLKF